MKTAQASICVLLAVSCGAGASSSAEVQTANPLGKVIYLLGELTAKVKAEGEAEAKAYADFFEWCDDTSKSNGFQIKTATSKKEKLEATIGKATADIEAATSKIEDLAGTIASTEADLKAATGIREQESSDFSASESELVETVDTLTRAIGVVSKEMTKSSGAFAQVDSTNLASLMKGLGAVIDAASFSVNDRQKLTALVQSSQSSDADDEDQGLSLGAPAAAVYKTSSNNILEVLEDMKEKADDQLSALRKAEVAAKHNYAMLKQSLEDSLAADNKDMASEKAAKSAAAETKAVSEGDLEETVRDLANMIAAKDMANSNCMQTAANHEETMAKRKEELKALSDATATLQEETGGAVKHSYSLLQMSTSADLAKSEVVTLVKRLAKKHHSAALAQLASRIAAVVKYGHGDDVFSKIKNLISELINKLETEAQADATEKAYCDEQMAETAAKKAELEDSIERLSTKLDQMASRSAGLKTDVKGLQADLAALAKQQGEMDVARFEENAAYKQAKADLEQGLSGVQSALGTLRDYYGSASEDASAAFMQESLEQPAVPSHQQATGAGQSIIAVLEVVASDFAKDLALEEMKESDSAEEYEKMTQENKVTKATKDQSVKYQTQEFKSLDKNIAELSRDREGANAELSAVNEYFARIKDRCIAKPETYEERKGRRTAEIAGLKEALQILESETAFFQRSKRGNRLRGVTEHKQ